MVALVPIVYSEVPFRRGNCAALWRCDPAQRSRHAGEIDGQAGIQIRHLGDLPDVRSPQHDDGLPARRSNFCEVLAL